MKQSVIECPLIYYSDRWFHHKLFSGHLGKFKWHESELWHSSGHLRRGFHYRHCSATLWQEIESEEWCSTFRDRLVGISHTADPFASELEDQSDDPPIR
jgi:hypothetical protein